MNNDDIIRLAIEHTINGLKFNEDGLLRFAKLIAQHEREACAKDLDEASGAAKNVDPQGFVWKAVKECADAIRARGQV